MSSHLRQPQNQVLRMLGNQLFHRQLMLHIRCLLNLGIRHATCPKIHKRINIIS